MGRLTEEVLKRVKPEATVIDYDNLSTGLDFNLFLDKVETVHETHQAFKQKEKGPGLTMENMESMVQMEMEKMILPLITPSPFSPETLNLEQMEAISNWIEKHKSPDKDGKHLSEFAEISFGHETVVVSKNTDGVVKVLKHSLKPKFHSNAVGESQYGAIEKCVDPVCVKEHLVLGGIGVDQETKAEKSKAKSVELMAFYGGLPTDCQYPEKTCEVEGCLEKSIYPALLPALCKGHYKAKAISDVFNEKYPMASQKPCFMQGCKGTAVKGFGFCSAHKAPDYQ